MCSVPVGVAVRAPPALWRPAAPASRLAHISMCQVHLPHTCTCTLRTGIGIQRQAYSGMYAATVGWLNQVSLPPTCGTSKKQMCLHPNQTALLYCPTCASLAIARAFQEAGHQPGSQGLEKLSSLETRHLARLAAAVASMVACLPTPVGPPGATDAHCAPAAATVHATGVITLSCYLQQSPAIEAGAAQVAGTWRNSAH